MEKCTLCIEGASIIQSQEDFLNGVLEEHKPGKFPGSKMRVKQFKQHILGKNVDYIEELEEEAECYTAYRHIAFKRYIIHYYDPKKKKPESALSCKGFLAACVISEYLKQHPDKLKTTK